MKRIRITARGWHRYTGPFHGQEFVDGVSKEVMPQSVADRIAAIIECATVDEDGNDEGQAGHQVRLIAVSDVAATKKAPMVTQTDAEREAEDAKLRTQNGNPNQIRIYTRDELEIVGSKEGLKGLRDIAKPWAVKDRSIPKLINEIVKAQENFVKEVEARKEDTARRRREAEAESLAKIEAEEAAVSAAARVLSVDETPNAIGPNGENVHVPPTKPVELTPKSENVEIVTSEGAGAQG